MRKVICMAAILMAMMIPCIAYGATLDASVSSPNPVDKGDNFNVAVKFSADTLDRVDAELEYDADGLSYVSGGSSSGDGGIVFINYATDNGKDLQVTLEFKAKEAGTYPIKLSLNEAYDMDGGSLEMDTVTRNVVVQDAPAADNPVENPDTPDADTAGDETPDITGDDADTAEPEVPQVQETEESQNMLIYIIPGICVIIILIVVIILAVRRTRRNRK